MSSSGKQVITIIIFPNKIQQIITGQQIITMHIFSNISKSGGNQSMKFGQLIEYDKKNIFLEKSYTKRRASPRTFSETLKSLGQQSSILQFALTVYPQLIDRGMVMKPIVLTPLNIYEYVTRSFPMHPLSTP